MKKTNQIRKVMNTLLRFAQDADEEQLEEVEKGEIETLKGLIGQAAPLMDQLASLPTIMAKTEMEEEAADGEDPDEDELKKAAQSAQDDDDPDDKEGDKDPDKDKDKGGDSGMDAKEIKKMIVETVQALMPKPAAPVQAMDAKEMLVQIGKRDALAKQLTPFIGVFDASEKTLAEVAEYGVEKLELKCDKGAELATLAGFLHNRQPAQPLQSSFGQDGKEGKWLDSQIKKEA